MTIDYLSYLKPKCKIITVMENESPHYLSLHPRIAVLAASIDSLQLKVDNVNTESKLFEPQCENDDNMMVRDAKDEIKKCVNSDWHFKVEHLLLKYDMDLLIVTDNTGPSFMFKVSYNNKSKMNDDAFLPSSFEKECVVLHPGSITGSCSYLSPISSQMSENEHWMPSFIILEVTELESDDVDTIEVSVYVYKLDIHGHVNVHRKIISSMKHNEL
jgi:hypothetical protein